MRLLSRHRVNFCLSESLAKVSSSFCKLKEGRFNKVVGIQRFKDPLILAWENWKYGRTSSNRVTSENDCRSSVHWWVEIIVTPPWSTEAGDVSDRRRERWGEVGMERRGTWMGRETRRARPSSSNIRDVTRREREAVDKCVCGWSEAGCNEDKMRFPSLWILCRTSTSVQLPKQCRCSLLSGGSTMCGDIGDSPSRSPSGCLPETNPTNSDCLLNSANSGFDTRCWGEGARMCALDGRPLFLLVCGRGFGLRGSPCLSTTIPK